MVRSDEEDPEEIPGRQARSEKFGVTSAKLALKNVRGKGDGGDRIFLSFHLAFAIRHLYLFSNLSPFISYLCKVVEL